MLNALQHWSIQIFGQSSHELGLWVTKISLWWATEKELRPIQLIVVRATFFFPRGRPLNGSCLKEERRESYRFFSSSLCVDLKQTKENDSVNEANQWQPQIIDSAGRGKRIPVHDRIFPSFVPETPGREAQREYRSSGVQTASYMPLHYESRRTQQIFSQVFGMSFTRDQGAFKFPSTPGEQRDGGLGCELGRGTRASIYSSCWGYASACQFNCDDKPVLPPPLPNHPSFSYSRTFFVHKMCENWQIRKRCVCAHICSATRMTSSWHLADLLHFLCFGRAREYGENYRQTFFDPTPNSAGNAAATGDLCSCTRTMQVALCELGSCCPLAPTTCHFGCCTQS